jgi:hypothetical protein
VLGEGGVDVGSTSVVVLIAVGIPDLKPLETKSQRESLELQQYLRKSKGKASHVVCILAESVVSNAPAAEEFLTSTHLGLNPV